MTDTKLYQLLALSERARTASSIKELGFLLVNDSHQLTPYRQAALWLPVEGVHTLSGVIQPEANAPYARWLDQVCNWLAHQANATPARVVRSCDLPEHLAEEWSQWWPEFALWVSLPGLTPTNATTDTSTHGGVVLVRDEPWSAHDHWLWQQWSQIWAHACRAYMQPSQTGWRAWRHRVSQLWQTRPDRRWWQQPRLRILGLTVAVLACPVPLSIMVAGELVPSHPAVIRAPLDGVIERFHVQPNQLVRQGELLFGFDEALIQSRVEVANQAQSTAETEYRQTSQQALADARVKGQLAALTGKVEERRAEANYLEDQLKRSRVLAPQDGIVLMDDPVEWIGRPVNIGERILRIAAVDDAEVEAWIPLADAVPLQPGTPVKLYLHASPLQPVSAKVRYISHDAVVRPDGQYAYRVRATLTETTSYRVGMKGSAKLSAGWVPLSYWMLRRPLAAIRTTLGI